MELERGVTVSFDWEAGGERCNGGNFFYDYGELYIVLMENICWVENL
jgi:hypothetical protein